MRFTSNIKWKARKILFNQRFVEWQANRFNEIIEVIHCGSQPQECNVMMLTARTTSVIGMNNFFSNVDVDHRRSAKAFIVGAAIDVGLRIPFTDSYTGENPRRIHFLDTMCSLSDQEMVLKYFHSLQFLLTCQYISVINQTPTAVKTASIWNWNNLLWLLCPSLHWLLTLLVV